MSLILQIFFLILVALILGLTLLSVNLRGFLETVVVYCLFFWEQKSMRTLLKKNLMAHKSTNKLTSVIYALTLGCVIFLCVGLNLMLKSVESLGVITDVDITVTDSVDPAVLDPILASYADSIHSFGYQTQSAGS